MANYRLGLDVGTNSIGWCALRLAEGEKPSAVLDAGVRIFHDSRDPKSGTSLAAERRLARGMRRRRDRSLRRQNKVLAALIRHGLMPGDAKERKALEGLDPYELRARGLDEALTPHELGRALFHLNQRRGFKSDRKADRDEKESGVIRAGVSELDRRIAESGSRTLGEYLHRRRRKKKPVRARPGVGFYPSRAMYEAEFDALWTAQATHLALGDNAREDIRDVIFFQRRLRPVEPGRCEFEPDEPRAPRALPLAQRFRMYQELNNLEIVLPDGSKLRLKKDERDRLYGKLSRQKTLGFGAMRKLLGLEPDAEFNLEDEKRKNLKGDETGFALAAKNLFGPRWWEFPDEEQDVIAEAILASEDEGELAAHAQTAWGLDDDAARRIATMCGFPKATCGSGAAP